MNAGARWKMGSVCTTVSPTAAAGTTGGVSATAPTLVATTGALNPQQRGEFASGRIVTTLVAGGDVRQLASASITSDAPCRVQARCGSAESTGNAVVHPRPMWRRPPRWSTARRSLLALATTTTAAAAGATAGDAHPTAGRNIRPDWPGDIAVTRPSPPPPTQAAPTPSASPRPAASAETTSADATHQRLAAAGATARRAVRSPTPPTPLSRWPYDVTGSAFSLASNRALNVDAVGAARPMLAGATTGITARSRGHPA